MNKSFERQRMSLKSSSRSSLVSSDSKRAAKTASCMRNGKSAFSPSSSNTSTTTTTPATTKSEPEEEKKISTATLKQEPEDIDDCDDFFEENSLIEQDSTTTTTTTTSGGGSSRSSSYPILTRVRSHSRSLRAMANPSAVWAHFDLCSNDPLRAQCRLCGAVVVRGGANPRQCGTTNLHRHLRVHHGGRLVGRRYHVMSDFAKRDQEQTHSAKALRLATQTLVRQMRQIAPAPLSTQNSQQQRQQQQQQRQQQQPAQAQSQSQQQQQQPQPQSQPQPQPIRTTKTLVLKTIPLKMKHISPTTIKLPVRQSVPGVQKTLPQTILPQQPTEVCLRWNSYHSNMQHSFPSLLDNEQFVDVTLACEGRSLKCHKMILSSCSNYLAQLLRENPCQHPIILMKDLKFWEVEALVKFMYRGEVNVTQDKLPQLLIAAEALQVKGLAGPSNSNTPKPPLLIPQPKATVPHQVIKRHVPSETKDNKPSTSSSATSTTTANTSSTLQLASPKRAQKRRLVPLEVPEARPFTKIRLQRPVTPPQQVQQQQSTTNATRQKDTSSPTVKLEPLDIPLSPGDALYHHITEANREDDDDDDSCPTPPNFERIIAMHEDDDPGGDDLDLADAGSDIDNDDSTNYPEEQMEFVPTDFLDQEQDIVEDPEDQTNCSSVQYTDEDSKHNNEDEEEEEEEEEEEDDGVKSEEEAESPRPDRTKKDKT